MGKRGEHAGLEKFKRALTEIGDVLRRAAQNPDELDLKPEVKAWLVEQFGPNKTEGLPSVTNITIDNAREVVRQQLEFEQRTDSPVSGRLLETVRETVREQWELEQRTKPPSGETRHAEKIQGRRKSRQGGDDLPPH